jgi:hypothetical protein
VLFILAYLCDANWWTLAAALRDNVTRTASSIQLTPSGKYLDYRITILSIPAISKTNVTGFTDMIFT